MDMWAEQRLNLCPACQEGVVAINGFWRPLLASRDGQLAEFEIGVLNSSPCLQREPTEYKFLYPQMRKDNGECLAGQEGGLGNNGSWLSAVQPVACAQRPKMPAVAIQMNCNQR